MITVILLPLKKLLTIIILLCTSQSSSTFVQTFTPPLPSQNVAVVRRYQSFMHSSTSNGNNFDYEYIPPRTAEDGRRSSSSSSSNHVSSSSLSSLTSTYPPNTPAGLRGEAIRSAIRSSNHHPIGWNFQNTIYECGIVEVIATMTGTTTTSSSSLLTFLNGKFTQYIALPSPTKSFYTETSFLNSKGQMIDKISIAIPNTSSSTSSTSKAYLMTSPGHTSQSLYNQLDPFIFPMDQIQLVSKSKSSFQMFHLLSSKLQVIQDCYTKYILSQLPLSNIQLESYQTLPLPGQCIEIPFVTTTTNNMNTNDPTPPQQQQQMTLLILPSAGLPNCAGYGYTFCFWSDTTTSPQQGQQSSSHIGHTIWQYMISEQCTDGPIEIGTLEYDTLRIECGQPLYNNEMTATVTKKGIPTLPKIPITSTTIESDDDDMADVATSNIPTPTVMGGTTPASPLELGLDYTIDTSKNKGCYQGQEGIASVLKNPRGPPRTLYQVIFDDDSNIYDYQSEGEYTSSQNNKDGIVNNLTRTPMPNDVLYVLGSNEEIMVGRITSVAEPSGTGEPITIALALIRRADSIQSSMKQMGIDMPSVVIQPLDRNDDNENGSILIPPPPLDVLDGLEVIIGGTFTIGTLRMIPSRRSGNTKFLFSDDDIPSFVQNLPSEQDMYDLFPLTKLQDEEDNKGSNKYESMNESRSRTATIQSAEIVTDTKVRSQPKVDNWDDEVDSAFDTTSSSSTDSMSLQEEEKELELAILEAEEAAKEAQRKAAKLELLRLRAEEAIARRKQKQQ